jgi:TRAP-type C4-dicarboxylate transport system permease small subunit
MIDKWLARCELVLVGLAVLSAVAMMLLTTADAMGRYLFNAPIVGAYELTEKYLMVAMIFLGLSDAFRGGVFIRVTFLVDRLPHHLKLATDYFAHLVSLAFCLITLYATSWAALRALSDDTTLATVPIPLGPAYCIVPVGFLALTVALVIDLPRVKAGASLLLRDETPNA